MDKKPTREELLARCRQKREIIKENRTKRNMYNLPNTPAQSNGNMKSPLCIHKILTKGFLLKSDIEGIKEYLNDISSIIVKFHLDTNPDKPDNYLFYTITLITSLLDVFPITDNSICFNPEKLLSIESDEDKFIYLSSCLYKVVINILQPYTGFMMKGKKEKMNFAKTLIIFLNLFQIDMFNDFDILKLSRESYNVDLSFLQPLIEKFKGHRTEELFFLLQ